MTEPELNEVLNREYLNNPKFKALADQIHSVRALTDETASECIQCKTVAALRLGIVQNSELPELIK